MSNEVYLTRKQVSEKLNITERTLKRWHTEGILPGYRLGHTVRYKESEVNVAFDKGGKKEPANG